MRNRVGAIQKIWNINSSSYERQSKNAISYSPTILEYCDVASSSQVYVVGGLPKGGFHDPFFCDTLSIL